ncbi:FAD-dependent monooxygenase [Klebsiella variicola subsp. variicola]|nr:FAD-dependent monooxygenase [Klebsiella variicola subsp. variicola]
MTTSTPDIQPAVQHTAQVAIAGAGPVGLMMANYLGQMGISVLLVEKPRHTDRLPTGHRH